MARIAGVGLVAASMLLALVGCSAESSPSPAPVTATPATAIVISTPTPPTPATPVIRTPVAVRTPTASPPLTLPAGLANAVAFDDGNTLELISCSAIPAFGTANAYRLSLVAEELVDVALDGAGKVTKVSVPTGSPELVAGSVSGGTEDAVVTGTARFADRGLGWTGFAFAFDSAKCTG